MSSSLITTLEYTNKCSFIILDYLLILSWKVTVYEIVVHNVII